MFASFDCNVLHTVKPMDPWDTAAEIDVIVDDDVNRVNRLLANENLIMIWFVSVLCDDPEFSSTKRKNNYKCYLYCSLSL